MQRPTRAPLGIDPAFLRRRALHGRVARVALFCAAFVSVFVTTGIVYVLVTESAGFFRHVSLWGFLTDTQ